MVLHLDHRKETTRLQELRTIQRDFAKQDIPFPDLIMGDFNALTANDYTQAEWNAIAQARRRNGWELPVSDVTTFVTQSLGLTDAYQAEAEAAAAGPKGTSRFDTRIDYVFFREAAFLAARAGWNLVACQHYDCK